MRPAAQKKWLGSILVLYLGRFWDMLSQSAQFRLQSDSGLAARIAAQSSEPCSAQDRHFFIIIVM